MKFCDRQAIKKVFEEVYAENVKTKNLEGYGDMYTENALWMAPNVPDSRGREDIIKGFAESISNQSIDPVFTADEIEVIGKFGYVIGISRATIYPDDGSPSKQAIFRALWLMKKVDGQWKIDRQIWNNKPLSEFAPMNKEQYRDIIETYFKAFRTGDFSPVKFSSKIQFLSPISQNTFDGVEAVVKFLTDVTTRVSEVNILSITVDYPTASGVWQMKTTKGALYTLNNFFRLDEEGIVYVWPMFDPKAIVEDPNALPSWLTGEGY